MYFFTLAQDRVMRTGVEKRYGELNDYLSKIRAALEANEWAEIQTLITDLYKAVQKVESVEERVPEAYFAVLAAVDDARDEVFADKSIKLNKTNSKGVL